MVYIVLVLINYNNHGVLFKHEVLQNSDPYKEGDKSVSNCTSHL